MQKTEGRFHQKKFCPIFSIETVFQDGKKFSELFYFFDGKHQSGVAPAMIAIRLKVPRDILF